MKAKNSSLTMGPVETRFAEMIWAREPVRSAELVEACRVEFDWNKSTTYTVLRRLTEKGIFKNENGAVTSVMTREDYMARRSEDFVRETFGGSLPAFIAAFTSSRTLTAEEADDIKKMIDDYTEEEKK